MIHRAIVRRIAGAALVFLLIAGGLLAIRNANGPRPGTIRVTAILGVAGSGLNQGTDVKVRGARVGKVVGIAYTEGRATALLEIDADPPLPDASVLDLQVTPKTFLGEKQVEIDFPADRFQVGPFLADGDTLVQSSEPTEVQAVLDALEPVFAAIDTDELALIIEAFAAQTGEGERIARNLEVTSQLSAFAARTADDQIDRLASLADIAEALAPKAKDFNRLNARIPQWATLLPEKQTELRASLDSLSRFSVGFAEFLEVEKADIDTFLRVGDTVSAVFERQADSLGDIVYGLYRYGNAVGHHGGDVSDGSEYGFFRAFIDGGVLIEELCSAFGDALPNCV